MDILPLIKRFIVPGLTPDDFHDELVQKSKLCDRTIRIIAGELRVRIAAQTDFSEQLRLLSERQIDIQVIAGPLIWVDQETHSSPFLDLVNQSKLKFYLSDVRQPFHFVILDDTEVLAEMPHPYSLPPTAFSRITDPESVRPFLHYFFQAVSKCKPVTTESDLRPLLVTLADYYKVHHLASLRQLDLERLDRSSVRELLEAKEQAKSHRNLIMTFDTGPLVQPLVEVRNALERLMKRILQNKDFIYRVDPLEFERIIREIFRDKGFDAELTKTTRDGGIDIFAFKKDSLAGPLKYIIQAKRYRPNRKVGVEAVRELYGLRQIEHATKAILVTTSYFTHPARQLEHDMAWELSLKDYADILDWISEHIRSKR